jgi:hypothetical protein
VTGYFVRAVYWWLAGDAIEARQQLQFALSLAPGCA